MNYRGYKINHVSGYGYTVKKGVVELAQFDFLPDAKEFVDDHKLEQRVNKREDIDYKKYCKI